MLTLSPDQIMSFRDEGLLVVNELIDQATVLCLRERFDRLFEGEFETGVQPDEINWQVHHIAVNGAVVLTERTDDFTYGEKLVSVPVMGTFEVRGGQIAKWRDYFDLAQFTEQFAALAPAE